jgi:hypothetical protein
MEILRALIVGPATRFREKAKAASKRGDANGVAKKLSNFFSDWLDRRGRDCSKLSSAQKNGEFRGGNDTSHLRSLSRQYVLYRAAGDLVPAGFPSDTQRGFQKCLCYSISS